MTYAEPTLNQLKDLEKDLQHIIDALLDDDHVYKYCSTLFNYRIRKAESLVKNLYLFFHTILYQTVHFTYSPQFGINLWPGHLGYSRNAKIEAILKQKESLFFTDFISDGGASIGVMLCRIICLLYNLDDFLYSMSIVLRVSSLHFV